MSSRNAPPHWRLLKTEQHSFPAISQLEFSSHFLEGVRATFEVWWLLQSQLCFYRCPMCEWQNNQNRRMKTSNQLEYCCRSRVLFRDKQQQQPSRANMMHNMDVLIKLPGIVSGNRLSIIYKIAFVWISTPGSLAYSVLVSHVQEHEHIRHMKFIIHMHVKKNQPILEESCRPIRPFFSLGIFLTP